MRGVREITVCGNRFCYIPQGEVREITVFGVPFLCIPLHEAFWLCCMYSMVLDPVFLYIPVTNDEKKCFQIDRWVMSAVIAERSAFGIWYLTNRTSEIRESVQRNYSKSLLPVFLLDLSIILPLPQVLVLLAYSQRISGQEFFSLMNLFLVQHGLKVIRLAKLITEWKNSYNLNKWANLTFNFGYLHAANVFGSLWYFFAVQRKAECWKKACTDFTRCDFLPLHCDDSSTNYTFFSDFCSTKTQNATIYDFGIFRDAIQSGVLDKNNFFRRYLPCFQWSLQALRLRLTFILSNKHKDPILLVSKKHEGHDKTCSLSGPKVWLMNRRLRLCIWISSNLKSELLVACGPNSIKRSRDLNLEEGTPRPVASVEKDISRIAREAAKYVYRTLNESLGNREKTSLQQIRDLPIRFLEANFFLIYVYSMVFDPVFLYLPVINDDKKCFQFDIWVFRVGIVERTGFDIYFLIKNALQLWENWHGNYSISLLPVFLFDLSIILPLPQVLVLLVYNRLMNVRKFFHVMNLFIVQHLLKVMRLYALIKKRKNSNNHPKWARRTFNLFYLHAANGFGALWYFFALQRKTECWRNACTDSTVCGHLPLYCDDSSRNYAFSNDFCSKKTQNATIYDFGIFRDAIQSGVLEQNNFFRRFFPCTQWSLQNLSSFGQGLPFSTNVLENIFAISITITGVVLFFFLIGKVQSEMSKADETRQKVRGICQWLPFGELSKKLQKKVRKLQSSELRETTGVDVEFVMNNLPEDLGKNIKQQLCLGLLKKVEEFGNWSDSSLETLCDVVKPVVFTERSYVLREGNPIDQMLFVLQGKLWTYTSRSLTGSSSNSANPNNHLEDGDFSGEELIAWAKADHDSSNLPISTKTIQALTKVEAFALMADDLKQVLSKTMQLAAASIPTN